MKRIDLTGNRYGSWTVLSYVGGPGSKWLCECDCGRLSEIQSHALRNNSRQCKACAQAGQKYPVELDVRDFARLLGCTRQNAHALLVKHGPAEVLKKARRSY